jgi:glycosyltransferase involved in cell wall biosynthesis
VTRAAVLLTSLLPGDLERSIAAGEGPRRDHLELCRSTGAALVPLAAARPRALRRLRLRHPLTALWMAWRGLRLARRLDVVVTDSEHVGLPLGVLLRLTRSSCRQVLVVHRVSTPLKRLLIRRLVGGGVSRYVVSFAHCESVLAELGVATERRVLVPYMVDTSFWAPSPPAPEAAAAPDATAAGAPSRRICAAGLERRDYPTLVEAVRDLDVEVAIAAASPWSRGRDGLDGAALPANVRLCRCSHRELRDLYASSLATVVPLVENDMQAGITTIVESLAMGRPVVVSRTTGQRGTVVDGVTGLEVEPGDPAALRRALRWLLDHPEEGRRMGEEGRRRMLASMTVEHWARRMAALVEDLAPPSGAGHRLATPRP